MAKMMNITFVDGVKNKDSKCPMCCDAHARSALVVSNMSYNFTTLHLSRCLSCGTMYYTDESPVIGYDFGGFNEDYWYNYVQNGAGITAMLEPLLAISSSIAGDLLDVGCGFGFVPHYWETMGHGRAVGLETSLYGSIGSEKLGTTIIPKYYRDATEIEGRKFNYVFSSEVIEHTPDPRAFINEISSALTDDGILVLTTPSANCVNPSVDFSTVIAALSPGFHYFITTKDALKELLGSCGYEHVHVHDTGTRLMAWASHKELPEIEVGFRDWDRYINYLECLQRHPDLHIAGGAAYRALKDSVNLGRWSSAYPAHARLLEISKLQYGIDLSALDAKGAVELIDVGSGFRSTPSWLGCAILFSGLVRKSRGTAPRKLASFFRAATEIMKQEIMVGAQFAQEASYFLGYAEDEYRAAQSHRKLISIDFKSAGITERARAMLQDIEDAEFDSFFRELGQELAKSGHQKEAKEALAEACSLAPGNALNHAALGILLMQGQKLAEAYACFRYALNCSPDARSVHALIASSSLGLGAISLAEYHARRAIEGCEQQPLETDALARMILNVALLRSDSSAGASDASMVSSDPHEQVLLAAMQGFEKGEFELGLFNVANLVEGRPDDEFTRNILRQGIARFKTAGVSDRFEEFVDSLGLAPLTEAPPAGDQNAPSTGSIDIIIPVHNALDDLQSCIASIRKWPSKAMGRIILVNDASDPETRTWIDQLGSLEPDIHVIHNAENLGFTRTVMAGMRGSDAEFAVMLNSDTLVTAGWLDGLWRAMNRRATTALAGPLTNNSYYQTIQTDESGHLADDPDRVAAMVLSKSRHLAPVVPLLSGFCLLVQRDAFDQVGGLDEEAFPWGYWEVQDLCLRLKDAGYEAVIADDVYVHHSGSKSIANARKELLVSQGLRLIHDRHSAIRFYTAETLCALEPVVNWNRHAWAELETELGNARAKENGKQAPDFDAAEINVIKMPSSDFLVGETCLFVTHAPFGSVSEYTLKYINALRATGITVLVCMTTEKLDMPVDQNVLDAADGLVQRQNVGYDFAAWADMLRIFPEVWRASRLYFVNDSVTGPFGPLNEMIAKIRHTDAGFFALTDCTLGSYHAQSYFFGWNRSNLVSRTLQNFWQNVKAEARKEDVIEKYERQISVISDNLPDQSRDISFGFESVLNAMPDQIPNFSMSHHAWRLILSRGFPFIKTNILRESSEGACIDNIKELNLFPGMHSGKIKRHIETSRIARILQ